MHHEHNAQTNRQTAAAEREEGREEERPRATAAERGVNHHGQQATGNGQRAGDQAGSYACQDECHIIAPKMVSKRQQRPS